MKLFKYAATLAVVFGLLSTAACVSTDTQSSTGEYIDDTVITAKVKTAIFNDDNLKSREISVETFKGVVQLSGFVSTRTETLQAGDLARSIEGVTSVQNDIIVK